LGFLHSLQVIVFLGYRGGGKTFAIERICERLVQRKYRIGVLKHTHKPSLDFAKRGKDSWRYSRAGANVVITSSGSQVTTLEQIGDKQHNYVPKKFYVYVKIFKEKRVNFLFVEGFFGELSNKKKMRTKVKGLHFILCGQNKKVAQELLSKHSSERILCILIRKIGKKTLSSKQKEFESRGIPVMQLERDLSRIIQSLVSLN
jgi:molybdopterin-guanine dinucleotide biosynthesis protein MobB